MDTPKQDWRVDPVLLLLALLIIFMAGVMVHVCHVFLASQNFSAIFIAVSGFVSTLIGALVMRINPKSQAQQDSDIAATRNAPTGEPPKES
jgi:membrane associated rhomboid family serine protease